MLNSLEDLVGEISVRYPLDTGVVCLDSNKERFSQMFAKQLSEMIVYFLSGSLLYLDFSEACTRS
jgi:hypothetical protein